MKNRTTPRKAGKNRQKRPVKRSGKRENTSRGLPSAVQLVELVTNLAAQFSDAFLARTLNEATVFLNKTERLAHDAGEGIRHEAAKAIQAVRSIESGMAERHRILCDQLTVNGQAAIAGLQERMEQQRKDTEGIQQDFWKRLKVLEAFMDEQRKTKRGKK